METTSRRRTDGLDIYLLPLRIESSAVSHCFPGDGNRMPREVQRLPNQVQIVSLDLRNVVPDFRSNHLLSDVRFVVQSEACNSGATFARGSNTYYHVLDFINVITRRGRFKTVRVDCIHGSNTFSGFFFF
jgi:hypothetical protein